MTTMIRDYVMKMDSFYVRLVTLNVATHMVIIIINNFCYMVRLVIL